MKNYTYFPCAFIPIRSRAFASKTSIISSANEEVQNIEHTKKLYRVTPPPPKKKKKKKKNPTTTTTNKTKKQKQKT